MTDPASVADKVRLFMLEELDFVGDASELTDEYQLLEMGALDSLRIMALVEYLEAEFEIIVDEDDIVAESFETIRHIADLVGTKQDA